MFVEDNIRKIKNSIINKTIKDIRLTAYGVEIIFTDDTEIDVQTTKYNVLLDEKYYSK